MLAIRHDKQPQSTPQLPSNNTGIAAADGSWHTDSCRVNNNSLQEYNFQVTDSFLVQMTFNYREEEDVPISQSKQICIFKSLPALPPSSCPTSRYLLCHAGMSHQSRPSCLPLCRRAQFLAVFVGPDSISLHCQTLALSHAACSRYPYASHNANIQNRLSRLSSASAGTSQCSDHDDCVRSGSTL
jgi:hypothetical protein